MRLRPAALIAALAIVAGPVLADDALRLNPRYDHALYANRDRVIDPDGSIYGLQLGASEKQVVAAFGPPNGVIAISDTRKAFLYGKSHLFVFRGGRLRELRVGDHMVDWQLARQMDGNPFFDRSDWVLKPGLRNGMNFDEVRSVLGRPGASPNHQFSFDTPEGYRLYGFAVVSYAQ
jgi:hypothetical protein